MVYAVFCFTFFLDIILLAVFGTQVLCATLIIWSPFLVSGFYVLSIIAYGWKTIFTASSDVILTEYAWVDDSVRKLWLCTFLISTTVLTLLFARTRRTKVDLRETFIDYKKTFVDPTSNTATDKRL